ncbi:MAG TPA: NAD(+)/NADH kinase [Phycisphaerales bacterium]|nr:NAD(+)/NADH kinase [Phycisphaerales bacterium]HMP37143.1 NAD(+)/NADH kinase [Phycisphaerales bacterium]
MRANPSARRVLLLPNRSRREVAERLDELRSWLSEHATIVAEIDSEEGPIPTDIEADIAIALGGDGTIIGQARRLLELRIPIVGVNFGRLGFLAEFDEESLRRQLAAILGERPMVRERLVLLASIEEPGAAAPRRIGIALNDCVIAAGRPFRMVELRLEVDGDEGPTISGDGLIVATPTGSTAHNVSAGGPIVHPDLEGIVITANAAHSLAFRPIVTIADTVLRIHVVRANAGSMLVLDGEASAELAAGQVVTIRRHPLRARFVANPEASYWRTLIEKLRWAAPPTYRT